MVINASRWSATAGWRNPPELLITILILIVSLLFGDTRSGELWQLPALSCINTAPCFTCARQAGSSLVPTCLYRDSLAPSAGEKGCHTSTGRVAQRGMSSLIASIVDQLLPVSCSTWPNTPGFMFHVAGFGQQLIKYKGFLGISCTQLVVWKIFSTISWNVSVEGDLTANAFNKNVVVINAETHLFNCLYYVKIVMILILFLICLFVIYLYFNV